MFQDVLVRADRVHTFQPGTPDGDTVWITAGRIRAVGAWDQLKTQATSARAVDLRGTTLTPGFTDSHIHLTEWAIARREVDVTASPDPEHAAAQVGAAAAVGTGWLTGRGWNPHMWTRRPHRRLLDAVTGERPVALQSHDMHSLWANSRALQLAGITRDTPDPEGGRIDRDDSGEPTGVLRENANQLVVDLIPKPSAGTMLEALREAQHELHRRGVTAIHSLPGIYIPEPDPLPMLESLRARDQLRLRVLQHFALHHLDEAISIGLRSGFGGDWIRIGGVKMFLDGALGSCTARMLQPYEGSDDLGVEILSRAEFSDIVRRAADAGIASTVHAIGDAAVALAFDVLSDPSTRVAALPHRVEHVQCMPPGRWGDPAAGQLVCSMQPSHLLSDWRAADRHWGRDRASRAYACGSLLRAGALLAFGSDAPVETVDPLSGLFAATCRRDLNGQPEGGWFEVEQIGIADAVYAYTAAPAMADRMPHGRISAGMFGDIVAWNRDPLAAHGSDILELECVATFVGGEPVWTQER